MASCLALGLPRILTTRVSPSQWKNGGLLTAWGLGGVPVALRPSLLLVAARGRQPFGQLARSRVFDDVFVNQFAHHLRRGEVLLGADLLEELFLVWIDQERHSGGAVFHGALEVHVMCME